MTTKQQALRARRVRVRLIGCLKSTNHEDDVDWYTNRQKAFCEWRKEPHTFCLRALCRACAFMKDGKFYCWEHIAQAPP